MNKGNHFLTLDRSNSAYTSFSTYWVLSKRRQFWAMESQVCGAHPWRQAAMGLIGSEKNEQANVEL
jgi:hypothetical protein